MTNTSRSQAFAPETPRRSHAESGFTLIEVLLTVGIIAILSMMVGVQVRDKLDVARLARCKSEMRSIQSTAFAMLGDNGAIPTADQVWANGWNGRVPGPYVYVPDSEDANNGHGNDLDGYDEGNPGNSTRTERDIKFVIICKHDHKHLARYVYIEDEGAPHIASDGDDPGYAVFANRNLDPGGGNGGGNNGGGNNGGGNNGGGKPPK